MRAGTFMRINIVIYTIIINGPAPFPLSVLSGHLRVIKVYLL